MFTYSKITTTNWWPNGEVGSIQDMFKPQPKYDFGPLEEAWKTIEALNTIRKQQGL